MNKKIYIGIGLLVGGFFAKIILFIIFPLLVVIGYVMVVVGSVFLVLGIAEKKKDSSGAQPINNIYANTSNTAQVKTEYCADCKTDIEQNIKNQHTVCSVCGVDFPIENMHIIDDALFCHACFLKQYGNIDSYNEEESGSTMDNAVVSLRNQIISEITKNPAVKYQLTSLLWQDAANCFPKSGFQWDGAWFMLDLQTGELSADVATYPNQFGAGYEDSFPLSAMEFNRIAKRFNMSNELQVFKSDEDWAKLFDDKLKSVVSSACATLQKQEEARKREEVKENAVKIPVEYAKQTPGMYFSEITIEISQSYSNSSIMISNKNGNYLIVYVWDSHMSPSIGRYPRLLSDTEAVWLENQVENTIKNPDASTRQSLPGGDTMNIVIKRNKGNDISLRNVKPIKKYLDLQNELEHLAQYGSLTEC